MPPKCLVKECEKAATVVNNKESAYCFLHNKLEEFDEKFGNYCEGAFYEKEDVNLGDELKAFLSESIEQAKEEEREKYVDALIWCSGSEDFQLEGKAREGWEKICQPL